MVTRPGLAPGPPRRLVRRPHDCFARFRTSFRGGDLWRCCCGLGRHAPLWRAGLGRGRPSWRLHARTARRVHRRNGAVRLRQVHADAHPRGPRRAHHRSGLDRRRGDHRNGRRRAHPAAPAPDRFHLPVLQPAAHAHGGAERGAAAVDRRREAGARMGRRGHSPGRSWRAADPSAVGALRRPAPATRSSR